MRVSFAGACVLPLSCALAVSRTQPRPTGQVPRVGELLHLYAEFCDQGRGGQAVDAGNRIQPIQYFFVRNNTLLNRLLKAGDLSLYEFKVVEEFAKHESL